MLKEFNEAKKVLEKELDAVNEIMEEAAKRANAAKKKFTEELTNLAKICSDEQFMEFTNCDEIDKREKVIAYALRMGIDDMIRDEEDDDNIGIHVIRVSK